MHRKKEKIRKKAKKDLKELKILYVNANGIKGKVQSLETILKAEKIQVASITETKLTGPPPRIDQYTWLTSNRKKGSGGGVAFIVKNDLIHKERHHQEFEIHPTPRAIMKPIKEQEFDEEAETVMPTSFLCSYRLGLSVLGFFLFLVISMQRVSIAVAILCMVNHTAIRAISDEMPVAKNLTTPLNLNVTLAPDPISEEVSNCGSEGGNQSRAELEDGPFVWEKTMQGHILGAYFYGYLLANFPAGILAEKFGPKWTMVAFTLLATLSTMFTPLASTVSPIFLIVLRVLTGFGSGALFPCMHVMWSRWAPPMERSKLAGISYAGTMAAACVGLPLSGVLCKYGFGQGWDSIFYVIGTTSAVTILLWIALTSNSPSESTRVSSKEKRYILTSLKGQGSETETKWAMPWLAVLKSPPIWGIAVSNFVSDWGLYTYLTNIPTFLSEVLQFDIQSNGLFSALPFLGLWINMNVSPIIADKLRSAKIINTTVTRKIFNTIGLVVPAIFLIGLGFVECSQPILGVTLLSLGVTFSGCAYTGFLVNHMDLAPKYAGTLLGITNSLASVSGFVAPVVAAVLTPNQSREEWQIVFFIAAGVSVFGAIIYLITGSGEIQPWAHEIIPAEEMELKNGHISKGDDNEKGDLDLVAA